MSTIEVIFLTSSVLTLATGLMTLALNPKRSINQTYAMASSLSAIWLFTVFMSIHSGLKNERPEALSWLRISNAFSSFIPWSFVLVKIAITEPGMLPRILRRSWPWFLASCFLLLLVYEHSFLFRDSSSEIYKRGNAYIAYVTLLAVLCALIMYDAYRKTRDCTGIRQLEIKFFVFNICISALIIVASFAASKAWGIASLRYVGPYVIAGSFGLTVWAICYHRVFDARQVFGALGRWLSSLAVLTSCTLTIHLHLSQSLPQILSLVLGICSAALLAEYWDRKVCSWLDLDSKGILAAQRTKIVEWAREESDTGKLTKRFETTLADWCHAESVVIHTVDSIETPEEALGTTDYDQTYPLLRQTGYITSETLTRLRPHQRNLASLRLLKERNLGAIVAVPRGSLNPSCVVAFSHKQSLRPYTYPDLQVLIELVELMDNILTHSRVAARNAQIEKMESAAMMSRGLAHDLNNLATPVSTFLMHMEGRVKPGSAEAEVLADAKHSIRVMQDYIRESFLFARSLKPNFEQVSANELVASTVKLAHSRALARGVALATGNVADAVFRADRALMQRLLQNLILNGIDATPPGGKVTVYAEIPSPNRIAISVADEGPGVPADLRDSIFEPYFTTKDTGDEIRGLGLGLAICLKISGLHGGEIDVGRAASGGAVFRVSLPLAPNP